MYAIEICNLDEDDFIVECCDEAELKKMLECDILDYTECNSIRCLISEGVDDIITNVNVIGEYNICGCELTPNICIYKY